MANRVFEAVAASISSNNKLMILESDNTDTLIKYEIINMIVFQILSERNSDFSTKIINKETSSKLIEDVFKLKLDDIDFAIFFILNVKDKSIRYALVTKDEKDATFENVIYHILPLFKANIEDFGSKFKEHKLKKEVYDAVIVDLLCSKPQYPVYS